MPLYACHVKAFYDKYRVQTTETRHYPSQKSRTQPTENLKQRMMEVMVTTGTTSRAKPQSHHRHRQTNIQFLTGRMSFLSPNQQCQSTEGKSSSNSSGKN